MANLEIQSNAPNERTFSLPVDSEHKATEFRLFSFASPHMRAFHLSWFSFFACFISSFAAPPLLPIIRDNLNLTAKDIGNAGMASVGGAIFARVAMGTACDLFGPRLASAALILITAPAVYCTAVVNSASTFFVARVFTGFSLATFVSTQFWMSSMFSSNVVGTANGVAAGWGNNGGGFTQLIMPLVYELIKSFGSTNFTAWRIAFFIPALFQTLSAFGIFFYGQDLPDGNYSKLQKSGEKDRDNFAKVLYHGFFNYRGLILALTYGFCFGVELTIDNIIAEYFYDRFNVNLRTAGMIAASFGLANLFARPAGGMLSDFMANKFGMRGRLWTLWVVQTLGGVFCLILGRVESLSVSIAVMVMFSMFVQAACGLTFGVAPFVSRRYLGIISGIIGAGGNGGAVVTQLIFFRGSRYSTETGLTFMGVMVICIALAITLIYFPQWGGMFSVPSEGATEEEYYLSEWNSEEQEKGFHRASLKFSENSRNERGRRVRATPAPTPAPAPAPTPTPAPSPAPSPSPSPSPTPSPSPSLMTHV